MSVVDEAQVALPCTLGLGLGLGLVLGLDEAEGRSLTVKDEVLPPLLTYKQAYIHTYILT